MSAYIVNPSHIAYFVHGYSIVKPYEGGTVYSEAREELRAELAQANIDSVKACYKDCIIEEFLADTEGDYIAECRGFDLCMKKESMDLIQLIKSAHCLDYQLCEVENWKGSDLQKTIESAIYNWVTMLPGYNEAEWGAPEIADCDTWKGRDSIPTD